MFEKAIVYRAGVKTKVDIGLLAETLFFYGRTHLLLDRGSLVSLVKLIPRDVLLDLFDMDAIQLSYVRQSFAVMASGAPVAYDFGAITLHGNVDGAKIRNHRDEIAETLARELGASRATQKFAQKIADRAALHRYRGLKEKEKVIPDLMRADLEDQTFVHNAVRSVLVYMVPDFDENIQFTFRVFRSERGDFFVDTDLDFKRLNEAFNKVVPPEQDTLTPARILAEIQDARADTFFAAHYMAEPVTGSISSDIMKLKHFEFLRSRSANTDDIELFHELVVPEFPTIREILNSGEQSFEEFVKFLPQANKFKQFLTEANPDVGLVKSYQDEVTRKSWIETLPGKSIRFVVAAGTGLAASAMVGPIGGLAAGVTNSFLLDRLLKGWKPNRFIQGPYKRFVLSE
jgi:hypothetical protein